MNEAFLMWVAGAGVLATLVLSAVVALRRSRREAARRQQAEAAALEFAHKEAGRAAAESAAARQAAAETEARRHTGLAARRQAEQRTAAEAAERAAVVEARAAVEAAYREGERLAAEHAAQQAAERAAALAAGQAAQAARRARERAARALVEHEAAARTAATVPAPAPAPAPAAPPPAAPPPRPRSPEETLVMVADDSKVVRVKTSRLLAQHRYRVVLAEDGQQAAQLIEQEVPLVLITDVEMPHMDGFALTRYVRQHPLAQHIPIIMITSADERLKAQAAEAGVTLVLGKPYEEAALLACIAQAMAGETSAA